jgi:hypothetical protein
MNATEHNWDFITAQLPAEWPELAVEMGLIRPLPPHLGAKIHEIEPILRMELIRAGLNVSLQTTTSATAAAKKAAEGKGGEQVESGCPLVDLAPTSLHAWERKLGPYLAELLARMVDASDVFSALRWSGYEVIVADGTVVTRPGAKGTTALVCYAMRLASMTLLGCIVTDEHGSESLRTFPMSTGQLWICDRGYANPEDVDWVVKAGADVLVRHNRGSLPVFDAEGERIDVLASLDALQKPEEMAECAVSVHPKDRDPIAGRLCVVRLCDEHAAKARHRLRREYGRGVSRELLAAAAWMTVFTTVPKERLSTQQVLALYRLRWQMELHIKRDKSLGGLDKLPNRIPETIATWLYAKLLIQQIARKIVSPTVSFPPSAVGLAVSPSEDPHEATRPRQARGRRGVARDGAGLPGHPCRPAPSRAA